MCEQIGKHRRRWRESEKECKRVEENIVLATTFMCTYKYGQTETHTWRENWPRTFSNIRAMACVRVHARAHKTQTDKIVRGIKKVERNKPTNERTNELTAINNEWQTFGDACTSQRPFSHAKQTFRISFNILHSFYVINGLLLIRISDRMVFVLFSFDVDSIFSLDYNSLQQHRHPPLTARMRVVAPW